MVRSRRAWAIVMLLFTGVFACSDSRPVRATTTAGGYLTGWNPSKQPFNTLGEHKNSIPNPNNPALPFVETYANLGGGDFRLALTTAVRVNATLGSLYEATGHMTYSQTGRMTHPDAALPDWVEFKGTLHGEFLIGPGGFHIGEATFGSVQLINDELLILEPGFHEISIPVSATANVDLVTGEYSLTFSLRSETWGRFLLTESNLSNTFKVTEMVLPNGRTPESEGWSLSFNDGAWSPNVLGRVESIEIVNRNFELPADIIDGQFLHVSPPGWSCSEEMVFDCGVMNPSPQSFPSGIPEGENVLTLARGGRIDQVLGSTLEPGHYKFRMDVGQSINEQLAPFIIQLKGGSSTLVQSTGVALEPGTFTTLTLDYFATSNDANLGELLSIVIDLTGNSDPNPHLWVDNVRLEFLPDAALGDFNHDGIVDAADYVTWRKSDNTHVGYAAWRNNYGRIYQGSRVAVATPEPCANCLTLSAIALLATMPWARNHR